MTSDTEIQALLTELFDAGHRDGPDPADHVAMVAGALSVTNEEVWSAAATGPVWDVMIQVADEREYYLSARWFRAPLPLVAELRQMLEISLSADVVEESALARRGIRLSTDPAIEILRVIWRLDGCDGEPLPGPEDLTLTTLEAVRSFLIGQP